MINEKNYKLLLLIFDSENLNRVMYVVCMMCGFTIT